MADGQAPKLNPVVRQSKQGRQSPRIAALVDRFMAEVERVADDEDWKESDGWVGRMVLKDARGDQTYVYEIRDGRMRPTDSRGPFVATITMGVDTFLDLIDAAVSGRDAELVFERKYAARNIVYDGERWIVDSERFRKVFRRLGSSPQGQEVAVVTVVSGQRIVAGLQALVVAHAGSLSLRTPEAPGFVDITDQVEGFVEEAGVTFGLVAVFSRHTTAAVVVNEKETMLLKDIGLFLERLAPRNAYYHHNDFSIRTENMTAEECPNGHTYCQHWVLGSSQVIPAAAGKMALGRWQRIFLVELDMPRDREVVLQAFGVQVAAPSLAPQDGAGKEG
ncbi:MAG: YjbQ family protein [Deltaproteobacteria bacterium]|nr:YjbQ family protein [Deltaproteobacteria bacterium]